MAQPKKRRKVAARRLTVLGLAGAIQVAGFAIWSTIEKAGPFGNYGLNESFVLLLTFMISVSVPSLALSADGRLLASGGLDETVRLSEQVVDQGRRLVEFGRLRPAELPLPEPPRRLLRAIADYNGVEPENVVLGQGADNLLILCARSYAGPGDRIAIADEPSYPLYRVAAWVTGADVGDVDPVVTFVCRPHNPSGAMVEIPKARPLVVDEAYFEYAGESAVELIDDGVIVIRTFSKAFALAGARIGYLLASRDTAAELRARQAPAPVSTLSVALALAALRTPPDVAPVLEERERLASRLRELGYAPLDSRANFLFVPVPEPDALAEQLLARGCVVRVTGGGVRITVRDNGRGIPRELADRVLEPGVGSGAAGLGLASAAQRVAVFYGEHGRLRIASAPRIGTLISIVIPTVPPGCSPSTSPNWRCCCS